MDDAYADGRNMTTRKTCGALVLGALLTLVGCADAKDWRLAGNDAAAIGSPLPDRAVPASAMGAYLAGRVAQEENDFPAALAFYQGALVEDPGNDEVANRVLALAVNEGRFDIAGPLSAKLATGFPDAGLANLVQAVEQLKAGHYDRALDFADRLPKQGFHLFAGTFARAWIRVADPHQLDKAEAEFTVFNQTKGLDGLKMVQIALLQDLAGDDAGAAASYDALIKNGEPPLRIVQLAGNFLERQGRTADAKALYHRYATENAGAVGVAPVAAMGGPPPRIIADAKQGLAEALFDLASLVGQSDSPEVAMLSVRLALELTPNFPLAQIVLADAYEAQHRTKDALAAFRSVDPASPFAWTARLHEAASMEVLGDKAGAEALLTAMAAERPEQAEPLIELGDSLRSREEFAQAAVIYTEALKRQGETVSPRDWALYFSRGICYERGGQWPAAEVDLRKALQLQPKEAAVLNYLGYSLVDRKERLPEALKLIKEAVTLRPSDGFIVDSLGWAYFRLGDFKNAQNTLERAVELQPADAEITDHLGDAYWQGGRHDEAKFQWRRALDLNPATGLAKSIEAKLDHPPRPQHSSSGSPTPRSGG
jgi:tetratricopeptide (TPR) repeat protein